MAKNMTVLVGILFLLVAGMLYFKPSIPGFSLGCTFARPYFGSINCETLGSPRTVTVPADYEYVLYNPNTPGHSDKINPLFMGIKNSNFPDPQCGMTALFKSIRLQEANFDSNTWFSKVECDYTTSLAVCRQRFSDYMGKPLDASKKYRVRAYCGYISGEEPASNQYDYNWNIQFNDEVYKYYKDSTGGIPISGTEGCKYNTLYDQYYSQKTGNQPNSLANWQKLLNAINPINNVFGSAFMPTVKETNIPIDSYAGQAYLFVQEWVTRSDLNVKNYNGVQVYCDSDGTNSKLYKVEPLPVNSGQYCIPTAELTSVECCEDTTCLLTKGSGYSCDETGTSPTFKCIKTETTQCYSDFDCGSQQTTCSKDQYSKYWLTSGSKCVSGKCQTPTKTEVKCCTGSDGGPQECSGYCDYQLGCKSSKVACPKDMWCVDSASCPYYSQSCGSGLTACPSGGCLGECKTSCGSVQCSRDVDCDDKNSKTTDKCVSDWLGNKKCENVEVVEKGCFESCGLTNLGCTLDCYTQTWMSQGLKFIASIIFGLIVGLLVDNSLSRTYRKKKDILVRTLLTLGSFVLTVIIFNLMVVI